MVEKDDALTTGRLVRELVELSSQRSGGREGGTGPSALNRLRIAAHLTARLGVDVRPSDIAEAGTVRRAADFALGLAHNRQKAAALGRLPTAPGPLSHVQERLLLAEEAEPGTADNNIVFGYLLTGPLRSTALRTAFADVQRRHQALRTVFGWDAELSPVQRTLDPEDVDDALEIVPAWNVAPGTDPEDLAALLSTDWQADGFALEQRPPIRARLATLGPERHLLLLNVHHIAFDGWSEKLFRADLATAYTARVQGLEPDSPPVPGYRNYVHWEREQVAHWSERELPFWRRVLPEVPAPVLPPVTTALNKANEVQGEHHVLLSAEVVRAFTERGRAMSALPLAVLLSSTAQVLGERFGADRLHLGTVFSGRVESEFHQVIGCFVNPVVVPLAHRPRMRAADRLRDDSRTVLECLANARTPFDVLVRELFPSRGRASWYEALVLLHGDSGSQTFTPDVRLHPVPVSQLRTSSDLIVQASPWFDGGWRLSGRWSAPGLGGGVCQELLEELADELRGLSRHR